MAEFEIEYKEKQELKQHKQILTALNKIIELSKNDNDDKEVKAITDLRDSIIKVVSEIKFPELKQPDITVTTNQESVIQALNEVTGKINDLITLVQQPKEIEIEPIRGYGGVIQKYKIKQIIKQ